MSRILAIDYGEKRIGLAISDEEQTFSFELDIYSPTEFFSKIADLVENRGVTKVIVGYPLNMSGKETKKTEEVKIFKEKLEQILPVKIEFIDERLSSKMAESLSGTHKNIDALAAQIFLQSYLDKYKKA